MICPLTNIKQMIDQILNWVLTNSTSLGAGVAFLGSIVALWQKMRGGKEEIKPSQLTNPISNSNNLVVNNFSAPTNEIREEKIVILKPCDEFDKSKQLVKILFIDDDVKFKAVSILKKAGWTHAKSVKDIDSTDCDDAKEADIFFVDIQGVGILMGFKDEGLGLALALKKKYPDKKVVIYSADQNGTRFHAAFNAVDYQLSKDADPYEFQNLVEEYCKQLHK